MAIRNVIDLVVPYKANTVRSAVFLGSHELLAIELKNGTSVVYRNSTRESFPLPITEHLTSLIMRPYAKKIVEHEIAAIAGGPQKSTGIYRCDLTCADKPSHLHLPRAYTCAYSHDGKFLAGGTFDGIISIWHLLSVEPEQTFHQKVGDGIIRGLAFSDTKDKLFVNMSFRPYYIPLLLENPVDENNSLKLEPCIFDFNQEDPKVRLDWDCYCMATHSNAALVAFAGNGDKVVLFETDENFLSIPPHIYETGMGSYINELCFVSKHEQESLFIIGEKGVKALDLMSQPAQLIDVFSGRNVLTVNQYGHTVYVVQAES